MSDLVKTPERLKLSILNHALSGRLTKQLPSDGDAHDLVNNIINKKQKLIKSHKIRKHQKLPIINKNEIPFKIPKNWCWVRFSSLYDMVGGSQPPKATFIDHQSNGYIRLYQTRDYGSNPRPVFIPKNRARKISQENDILVARYGGSLGEIFKAHYGAYNVALAKVTPIVLHHELNIGFIWYYLKSDFYQNFVRTLNKSAQAGFNKTDLIKLLLPVPPLSEQHRIVQRLNEILPKVDDLNKDVVKLDQIRTKFPHRLKQSLLLEAMKGHLTQQLSSDGNADNLLQSIQQKKQQLIQAGKIRKHKKLPPISKDKIPFKIPKNWEWVRLGTICPILEVPTVSKNEYQTDGIPFYRIKDITELNKGIKPNISVFISKSNYLSKIRNKGKVKKNDILIVATGATLGGSYVLNSNDHIYFQGSNNIIWIKDLFKLDSYFINSIFKMNLFYKMVRHMSKGSAIKHLNIGLLSNLLIPLPPLSEQHRIVSKLHDLFNTINA